MKVYVFLPPDRELTEVPIEISDETKAIKALNKLIENGTLQGFLMLLNQQEKRTEKK